MEYKVLYRKYRPTDFNSVYGQDYTVKILQKSINLNKISHAYLFTGPRGTGKTSTAKIFAKAINCLDLKDGNPCGKCDSCLNASNNPDIIELDAASNNGVDEIRNIIESVRIAPSFSKYKVYIIDEVHMLTQSAFNALLLTLEEPPGNVVFILATTDVQKVPITILSRCQRFDFKPIDTDDIYKRLKYVSDEEKLDVDEDALREIAYISNGGLRDALSILDQLSGAGNKITLDDVYSNFGTVSSVKIKKLVEAFTLNNQKEIIELLTEFKNNGVNAVVLTSKIIEELRLLAIDIKCNNKDSYIFDSIYDLIVELNKNLNNGNINLNPYILIELAMLKYTNREDSMLLYDFDNKNISREIKEENNISQEIKKDEKSDENISREILDSVKKDAEKQNFDQSLIDIRVNNCFYGADRKYKNELIEMWPEFLDYVEENFKSISSYLKDSVVSMASDKYIVLTTKKLSTADLINEKSNVIKDVFLELYDKTYNFVCLSDENWLKEVEKFKKNKFLGKKYEYIEENETVSNESVSDLDSIANDLFGKDMVEYE